MLSDEERAERQRVIAGLTGEPVGDLEIGAIDFKDGGPALNCPDAALKAEADALLADLAAQKDDYLRGLGDGLPDLGDGGVYGDGLTLWDQA